jgi:hypothetical protein
MELGPMTIGRHGCLGKTRFLDIGKKLIVQEIDLILEMEIKRSARAAREPVLSLKRLNTGNGKVKMLRRDTHAEPVLHKLKER